MTLFRAVAVVLLSSTLLGAQEWTEEKEPKKMVGDSNSTAVPQVPSDSAIQELPGMKPESATPPAAPAVAAAETAVEASSTMGSAAAASMESGYAVQKGDTLWGLAGKFYNDNFAWKRIWDANRTGVADPNLIYPDQRFTIPGVSVKTDAAAVATIPAAPVAEAPKEEPAAATSAEEVPAAPEPVETPAVEAAEKPAKTTGGVGIVQKDDSFVAEKSWQGDGRIVGDKDKKLMISLGDIVYTNLGSANGLKAGMRANVYRKGRVVFDPGTHQDMGSLVRRIGSLQIIEPVGSESSSAYVTNSIEAIRVGDIVKIVE